MTRRRSSTNLKKKTTKRKNNYLKRKNSNLFNMVMKSSSYHAAKKSLQQQKEHLQKEEEKKLSSTILPLPTKPKKLKEELEKEDIIYAISLLLHNYILRNTQSIRKPRNLHCPFPGPPLFNCPDPVTALPSLDEIQAFIQAIFDKRRLPLEAGIIALILLNRTSIKLHSQNWMRMVLIALLLANKLCEDVYSVYNAKFLGLIPNLENLEINILEFEFLQFLKYRLFIDTVTYLRYYAKFQKFFPIEEDEEEEEDPQTTIISPVEDDDNVVAALPAADEEVVEEVVEEDVEEDGNNLEVYSDDIYPPPVVVVNRSCGSTCRVQRWQDYNFDLVSSIA